MSLMCFNSNIWKLKIRQVLAWRDFYVICCDVELVARPAVHFEDLPKYLCLRIGELAKGHQPIRSPMDSYKRCRLKPEYWFSIPLDRWAVYFANTCGICVYCVMRLRQFTYRLITGHILLTISTPRALFLGRGILVYPLLEWRLGVDERLGDPPTRYIQEPLVVRNRGLLCVLRDCTVGVSMSMTWFSVCPVDLF